GDRRMAGAQGGRDGRGRPVLFRDHLGGSYPTADAAEAMKLLVTGVSHKTTPVEVRECLAVPDADLPAAVKQLASSPGVNEALILSTCNRVEIMVDVDDETDPEQVTAEFLRR